MKNLIDLANSRGGKDNITAIVVEVRNRRRPGFDCNPLACW